MKLGSAVIRPLGWVIVGVATTGIAFGQRTKAPDAVLSRVKASLNVNYAEVQTVKVPLAPKEINVGKTQKNLDEAFIDVQLEGVDYELELYPHSLRAPDITFVLSDANGDHIVPEEEVPSPDTYRGRVINKQTGQEAGAVAATLHNGQVWATLRVWDHPTGEDRWAVQPVSEMESEASLTDHVIYRDADALPNNFQCGNTEVARPSVSKPGSEPQSRELGDKLTDIAIESDSFYTASNSNLWKATVRDIEKTMNDVEQIYETNNGSPNGSVDITYHVTYFVVRFAAGEQYTTNNASNLLNQMASHWNSTKNQARRDVAHLFTGRNIDGSTIGIAFTGTICNTGSAYGLSQSKFSTNATARAALTAHELGHNWSALHCDGAPGGCQVMCSGGGGCPFTPTVFSPVSITQITSFKNSRGCLSNDIDKLTFPIFDDFDTGVADPNIWNYLDDVVVDTTAVAEPSGAFSAKLTAPLGGGSRFKQGEMRTGEWAGACCNSGQVSFYLEHRNMEAGEETDLFIYVKGNYFKRITSIVSDGVQDNTFTFYSFPLDSTMVHPRARIKIVHDSAGGDTDDFAHIDNFMVTASTTLVFSPNPPRTSVQFNQDRPGRVVPLRVVGVEPGNRVVFFASIGHASNGIPSNLIPLGEDIAASNHVATTFIPLPGDIAETPITFHAYVVDGNGNIEQVQSLERVLN